MLQQTQVERVLAKYESFLSRFPDFATLAAADLREILEIWQGLGYNRRAIALHRIASRVVSQFGGRLPESEEMLLTFPGIGQATAGALTAFAFGRATVFLETNIRRVFIHFFFPNASKVKDSDILPLIEQTLDRANIREWYYALMDYGVKLRATQKNPNRRSAHYHKQAAFDGSDRQIRGMILKTLLEKHSVTERDLLNLLPASAKRSRPIIRQLIQERFLERDGDLLRISSSADTDDHGN